MDYLFAPDRTYSIPIVGEKAVYPVHRIFCVARNYAAHAVEMGSTVEHETPFYFTKTPSATTPTGATILYPPGTENLHHEIELALVIGKPVFKANHTTALAAIYGYACALDMTRRDLQNKARAKQCPWDLGKDFENAAIFAPITNAEAFTVARQRIYLAVNGSIKQDASLQELVWPVDAIVSDLSHFYHLRPGDVILTGTPAGVGPVKSGDKITGGIDGLEPIALAIQEP